MKDNPSDIVLKAISACIALLAIAYAWYKDLQLKKKTYSDKIRDSAGQIIAKLERRKSIVMSLYQEIQPLITTTDILIVETRDKFKTRDKFWNDINLTYNSIKAKILNEQIEIAYVNLIGYRSEIMTLYQDTIGLLIEIDNDIKETLLMRTQKIIIETKPQYIISAQLGNQLRGEVSIQEKKFDKQINKAVLKMHNYLLDIIHKNDSDIYSKV